ncbi:peptidoglycan-binding domain-containing protein [Metapseudomonas boanensis]|uniref:peptidoglycan-binding domain-containing protein n=1 Tax=Metapseudomonas boanensis TaxID=2822138 RepID=UPI002040A8F8|nr:peptidoglycan-binding domain-containing protein [Pseudomonas boanensis]
MTATGYNPDAPDGIIGANPHQAIRSYQQRQRLRTTNGPQLGEDQGRAGAENVARPLCKRLPLPLADRCQLEQTPFVIHCAALPCPYGSQRSL